MAKKQIEQTEIEAPYELPEGWKWMLMPEVVTWGSGGTPKATEPKYYTNGTIPWLIIADLNDSIVLKSSSKITKEGLENSTAKLVPPNTLLVAMYGSIGKLGITGIECCTNQAIAFAKELKNVTTKYMFYYMSAIKPLLIAMGRGGTQQNISQTLLNTLRVPLPSILEEQQRIVKRIETLFAKLDQAKEKVQNVVDTFETRKASILHKAFTGELTKKWREENGVEDDSWVEKLFSELGKSNLGKMLDAKKNTGSDVLYLRNVNVRWFDFDLTDLLTMKAKNEEIEKLSLKKGDLFICEGGEPGRCAVWKEEDSNIIFQKAIHRFKPNNNVSSDFIAFSLFYLNSIGQLSNYFTGTTIKHLTGQSLAKIKISLPSLPEQTEIVRILDAIFEKETKAKEAAEAVLEQIDLLKKSILARAFRGEL